MDMPKQETLPSVAEKPTLIHTPPELPALRQEYQSAAGLSHSAMKDLMISPLRYWYLHVNPDRPVIEPTPEQQLGSAIHCSVLEPTEFDKRYACEIIPPEGCLVTISDIREWICSKGFKPKGTRKDEIIVQAYSIPGEPPVILDSLLLQHRNEHAGKVIFKADDWLRIKGAAQALLDEPRIQHTLCGVGAAEVRVSRIDPDTGILLKGLLDWSAPSLIMDLKTFAQKKGKSIDRSIADAIFYEGYYRQIYFYNLLRGWPEWRGESIMPFVESEPPYEVRIKSFRSKVGGNANVYWTRAMLEVRSLIRLYTDCMERFGEEPWRTAQEINPLEDEDIPQLAYA